MNLRIAFFCAGVLLLLIACTAGSRRPTVTPETFVLDYDTPTDRWLQRRIEKIDARLRAKYGMSTEQTAVGVLDLNHPRLAMIHPDRIEYAASVAKIGILLAYFQLHPEAATQLDAQTEHELGLMIKASSNEMAVTFTRWGHRFESASAYHGRASRPTSTRNRMPLPRSPAGGVAWPPERSRGASMFP